MRGTSVLWAGILTLFVGLLVYVTPVFAQEDPPASEDQYDGGEVAAQQATCLETEEEIERFAGTDDRTTGAVEITGPEWRFISEATREAPTTATLDVDAFDEDGFLAGFTSQLVFDDEESNTQSSGVIDGPGTFTFEIDANGVSYDIVICQALSGSDPPEPPREDPPREVTDPPKEVIKKTIPKRELADTGGFPAMTAVGVLLIATGALIRRR